MNSIDKTMSNFCPFGYLDMKIACEIGDQVGLCEYQLFEIINEFRESCGYERFEHIDPVYCVMEHILQHARNIIDNETGYDFLNDFHGGTEIYTHGNYMSSSYDYSGEAIDELKAILESVSSDVQAIILDDEKCSYFLNELGIELRQRE